MASGPAAFILILSAPWGNQNFYLRKVINMKKNLLRLLAAVMAVAMVMSLAACGGDSKDKNSSSEPSSSESSASSENTSSAEDSSAADSSKEESSSETSSAVTTNGKYESIQAFLDDPTVKAQLDSMIESLTAGDDSMDVSVAADGDTLVYTFVFVGQTLAEDEITVMHDALESAMATQAATFENIAGSLNDAIEVSDPKVLVVYEAEDGTEIFSQEFSPSK